MVAGKGEREEGRGSSSSSSCGVFRSPVPSSKKYYVVVVRSLYAKKLPPIPPPADRRSEYPGFDFSSGMRDKQTVDCDDGVYL